MLYATNRFPGDGMTTQYEISFVGGYLDRTHVKAHIEGAGPIPTPVTLRPDNFLGPYTIGGLAPVPVGATLVIYRDTPKAPLVDFVNGSRFTEATLDTATRQGAFIAVEGADVLSPEGLAGAINQLEVVSSVAIAARDQAALSAGQAAASAGAAASNASAAGGSATNALHSRLLASAAAANASLSAAEAAQTAVTVYASVAEANTAADGASLALAHANALLGIGIGTSYVNPDGDLIITYVPPVTSVYIDADGNLSLDY